MIQLFQMWALIEALGIMVLPLTVTVFHNLPDRGWAFSKALGLALFAFCTWLPLMCIQTLPYNRLFIGGVLLFLLVLCLAGFWRTYREISRLVRGNIAYIITAELVFLGMVVLLGWLRSFRPDIRSWETFMDEGFIASIMRSPHMPPNDMWFSGFSINYYYYAHYAIATAGKLIGQTPSVVFNTGISAYFGLTAVNLLGVTSNIVAWAIHLRSRARVPQAVNAEEPTLDTLDLDKESTNPESVLAAPPEKLSFILYNLRKAIPYGLASMVMGLILGNLAATQGWWLDHGESVPYDWFSPSRVIPSTINEFPAFSFLLACFHAHVLTLAFTIMAMGLAFNLLLEPNGKGIFAFGRGWRLPWTLFVTALIIGGLFTMNGWDYPTYIGVAAICIGLQQWLAYERRVNVAFILDLIVPIVCLVGLSLLLFLPFYLNFVSPSQGFGLLTGKDRSTLTQEFLIYGLFLFVFLSLLAVSALRRPLFARVSKDLAPVMEDEDREGTKKNGLLSNMNPMWIGLMVLPIVDVLILLLLPNSLTFIVMGSIAVVGIVLMFYHIGDRAHAFMLLLGALAFALVAACEIVFLKDAFAGSYPRMNTVFKFYFQSWAMLSVACGAGFYILLERFWHVGVVKRVNWIALRSGQGIWTVCLVLLCMASMVYPLVAPTARLVRYDQILNQMRLIPGTSLDGLTYLKDCRPPDSYPAQDSDMSAFCSYDVSGDYYAIEWINAHIQGDPVIVEAYKDDYSLYSRISTFTGLPTIMGWSGHEVQWRLGWLTNSANSTAFNNRLRDVDAIYTSTDSQQVLSLLKYYRAQYLYVGEMERVKYTSADLNRFASFMPIVYQADGVTIYKVP